MDINPFIIVIEGTEGRGDELKELIEFMDVPRVHVANAENWQDSIGERRLAAVFLGDDLEPKTLRRVIREIGELDPNTPIVRVKGDGQLSEVKRRS